MRRNALSDLKPLFLFPFQGPDWANRFIIGCALLSAGWIGYPCSPSVALLYGYAVEVMRRVIGGEEPNLPPWQDWGRLFMDGLRAFAVGLVYFLPGTLVYFGGMGLYFASLYVPLLANRGAGRWRWCWWQWPSFLSAMFLGSLLFLLRTHPFPAAIGSVCHRRPAGGGVPGSPLVGCIERAEVGILELPGCC